MLTAAEVAALRKAAFDLCPAAAGTAAVVGAVVAAVHGVQWQSGPL